MAGMILPSPVDTAQPKEPLSQEQEASQIEAPVIERVTTIADSGPVSRAHGSVVRIPKESPEQTR